MASPATTSPAPESHEPPAPNALVDRHPWLGYAAPFAVFMLFLAVADVMPLGQPWESVVRVAVVAASLWIFSRHLIARLRAPYWWGSVLVGLLVFAVWVGPDALVPGWRAHWLFQNSLTGRLELSIPEVELTDPLVLVLRMMRAALLVPILEELFWRGWLPRWVQAHEFKNDFRKVPLGRYTAFAFVTTALLFAAEHGPYWEVGLLAGIAYNWWMWRTKSLGDLVLAHAVTNAALAAYVLATRQWHFWM